MPAGVRELFSGLRGIDLEGAVAAEGPALAAGFEPMVTADGAAVLVLDRGGRVPTLYLSSSIIGPEADLPRRVAFPVLVGRLCDLLAGRKAAPVALAVTRLAEDPLWTPSRDSPDAGIAAVYDRPPASAQTTTIAPVAIAPGTLPWTAIVTLLALLLWSIDAALRGARKIV